MTPIDPIVKLTIVNESTAFNDDDLPALANAMQIQVTRDFYPSWGANAKIYYTPKGKHPSLDHWTVALLDNADQAGALGYHDVTPDGQPLGKVFVKTTIMDGGFVSVTTSHEVLEMLADPAINLSAEVDDVHGRPAKFYAIEVGDPSESDNDAYEIVIPPGWDGAGTVVKVSDFVYPSWFEAFRKEGPYDFLGKISRPFELLPGGYISVLDLGSLSQGWQQIFAHGSDARARAISRPQPGSRRSRRALPRSDWLYSTYEPGNGADAPALTL